MAADKVSTGSGAGSTGPVEIMSEVDVRAGEWVLYRSSRYDRVEVEVAKVAKVTPQMVKFDQRTWPRQCNRISVVASFADMATAFNVRDQIGGVAGEFNRRRRSAEDERSRRITDALTAANRRVENIIAKAREQSA